MHDRPHQPHQAKEGASPAQPRRSAGTPRLSASGALSDAGGVARLSPTNEDYLEAIFIIGGPDGTVRSVDVASHLGVSKASVNKALGALKLAGLIDQPHYSSLTVTRAGAEYAASILRRHLVLFRFLTELLGVEELIAAEEACLMEHAISGDTLERFVMFLDARRLSP